jgi:hypothetical protein
MDIIKKIIKALFQWLETRAQDELRKEIENKEKIVEQEQQIEHDEHELEAAKATNSELDSSNDDMLSRLRNSGH